MGMAEAIKDDFVPRFQTYVTQPIAHQSSGIAVAQLQSFLLLLLIFGVLGVLFLKWPLAFL